MNRDAGLFIINALLYLLTALLVFFLLTFVAHAADRLTVVEDMGGSSALPYYKRLNPDPQTSDIKTVAPLQGPVPESFALPVISKKLSPGRVEARTANAAGLTQPVFFVGADELSFAWLKQRGPILREIGALGLVVNVSDAKSLAELRQAAEGLTLLPVCGDDLAGLLKIEHYPVLITHTAIEQ